MPAPREGADVVAAGLVVGSLEAVALGDRTTRRLIGGLRWPHAAVSTLSARTSAATPRVWTHIGQTPYPAVAFRADERVVREDATDGQAGGSAYDAPPVRRPGARCARRLSRLPDDH